MPSGLLPPVEPIQPGVPVQPPEPVRPPGPLQPVDPIQPGSPVIKPRKRSVIIALIAVALVIAGTAGYGGYRLLAAKPANHTAGPTAKSDDQPKKPAHTASKPKSTTKVATKPPTKPTEQPGTSAGSTTTTPPAKHSSAPAQSSSCKQYSNSFCYRWVGGRQFISASGVSVQFGQAAPKTMGNSLQGHTLVELSVGTADGKQYVEVGWILPDASGNAKPRLFVYHWVDGHTSCYNGCGFVQVSGSIHPGDLLTVGATGTYKINYSGGQWQVFYDGTKVGYFPESLWGGKFTQAGFTQIFGEVSSSTMNTCTQMGNGIYGSHAGSLLISNYTLLGSTTARDLSPFNLNNFNGSVNPGYNYGAATATSLRIGGPGSC